MKTLNRSRSPRRPRRSHLSAAILGLTLGLIAATPAIAGGPPSVAPAFNIWDPGDVIGTSTLVRTNNSVSATITSLELPPGQAFTMWIIAFNNPELCATTPCSAADLFNPAVQGDFLLGGGHVVGGSGRSTFGGQIRVGDISGSGHPEVAHPELAVGLLDPYGAEIHVVLHSHGPKQWGRTLKQQISSFTGGCQVFLGNVFGQAEGPADIPDATGECSTLQAAVHMP
jgi:hypothetical protein